MNQGRYFDEDIRSYPYVKHIRVYLRKSRLVEGTNDKEEYLDLETHRNRLNQIIKYYGFKATFYEEVKSGENLEDRPEMQRLLKDIEDGETDAILIYATDRLGRGADLFPMGNKFKMTKTLLMVYNSRQIYDLTRFNQKQMYDLQSFLAMQELELIKKRLYDGVLESMEAGNWYRGMPPLPYRYYKKEKTLIIDEKEYEIYLEVIDRFLDGENYSQLTYWLNNQTDIPSPRKATWSGKTVKNLLISTVHMGYTVLKGEGNKSKGTYRPFKKPKPIKGKWNPIKDLNIHNQIMAQVEKFSRNNNPNGRKTHALSELVYCGCCGKKLHIHLDKRNDLVIRNCKIQNTNEQCGNMGGKAKIIENEIITLLEKHLSHFKMTKNNVGYEKEIERKENHVKKLEKDSVDLEDKIFKAMEMILESKTEKEKTIAEKFRDKYINEQEEAEKELQIVKGQLEVIVKKSRQNKGEILEYAIENLKQNSASEEKNKIYKNVVERIYWKRMKENPYDLILQIHLVK